MFTSFLIDGILQNIRALIPLWIGWNKSDLQRTYLTTSSR